MQRRHRALLGFTAVALSGVLMASTTASAKGGPPHPPGEEETGSNNLSVPAIFVPDASGSPFTGTCPSAAVDPSGVKGVDTNADGVPDEHLDYYVQGVATWQSECTTAAANAITVGAEWGDNLTNAPLKAGTPIRVEIGFLADPSGYSMTGYNVVKLDPTLLDRESHYGTLGGAQTPFPEVRVWNSGVTLDIRSTNGSIVPANNIDFVAEVNSTGRVVYGFNWQQPVAGNYVIKVHAPSVLLGTTDAGTLSDSDSDGDYDTVALEVTVGNKGGGGGGGGGRPSDRPRGGGGGGGQG